MTNITSSCTFEITSGIGHTYKVLKVECPATTVSGDTFTYNLADAGATAILGIKGNVATTAGSVVADEAPTTSVSNGVLTVTVGGTAVTKGRFYTIDLK